MTVLDFGMIGAIVAAVALGIAAMTYFEFVKIRRMYRVFMTGTDQANLEQGVLALATRVKQLEQDYLTQDKKLYEVERRLLKSIQRVGMVRFNAFSDAGGEMSFAAALLDDEGNGVAISSIYGRAEARVYAKTIVKGESASALGAEESMAISQAMRANK